MPKLEQDVEMADRAATMMEYTEQCYEIITGRQLAGETKNKLAMKIALAVAAARLNEEIAQLQEEFEDGEDYIIFNASKN